MGQLRLALAIAAGFAGGLLSQYIWPHSVAAQWQTPKEIRAQRFVLQDANGTTLGMLSIEPSRRGSPLRGAAGALTLFDHEGREIWKNPAGGIQPLTQ